MDYLIKYLRQGIVFFNTHGNIITFNPIAKNYFALQGFELRPGTNYNNYCFDKIISRAIDNVIKNGVEFLGQISTVKTEVNKYCLKWDVVPLKGKDKKNEGAILLFEDITEINKLKKQVQEQERKAIAGDLAAGFVHEIRNPLSVAGGAIQLLEIVDDPKRQNNLIHKLRGELDSINQILTDFLDIAKPNKKRELKLIEIPKVIKEIEFLIKSDANLNNIKLTIDESSEQFPLMKGDSTHLKQVFLNIMKNAIEAMEDGGELKIAYYHNSKKVGVIFEDNGPGIAEENMPLILESFFTTKDTGTGLGLSVSSELVKSMDGELKIESIVGKGTIVRITFPVFRPTKNAKDHNK